MRLKENKQRAGVYPLPKGVWEMKKTKMVLEIDTGEEVQKFDINEIKISKDNPNRITVFSLYGFSMDINSNKVVAIMKM